MDVVALNLSYILMLLGLCTSDILWLRTLLSLAQVCFVTFGVLSRNNTIIAWNFLFLCLNIYQVLRILQERRPVVLAPALREIHQQSFSYLEAGGFLKLWNMGAAVVPREEWILAGSTTPTVLLFIERGKVGVYDGGKRLGELRDGDFLAEMEFITGQTTTVGFKMESADVCLRSWTRQDMLAIEQQQPNLCIRIQGILGRGVLRKLQEANVRSL